jgi:hypothetical protein
VHTGEVERPPGSKPRGIAVHVARASRRSRAGGEVLVELHDARPRRGLGARVRRPGDHALKGIEGLRRVYAAR